MNYLNTLDLDHNDFLLYGHDMTDYEILYAKAVSDWSWGAQLYLFQKDEKYYIVDDDEFTLKEVSQEEALNEILLFEEYLEE